MSVHVCARAWGGREGLRGVIYAAGDILSLDDAQLGGAEACPSGGTDTTHQGNSYLAYSLHIIFVAALEGLEEGQVHAHETAL